MIMNIVDQIKRLDLSWRLNTFECNDKLKAKKKTSFEAFRCTHCAAGKTSGLSKLLFELAVQICRGTTYLHVHSNL